MSIDDRHSVHDQNPEDLPTTTLAEPTTATRDPQQAHADTAAAPADPSTANREPTTDGRRSAPGEDGATHGEVADTRSNQPSPAEAYPSTTSAESGDGSRPAAQRADGSRSVAESSSETALFADDELAGLRARWDSVQAGFVDDPKECVHKADGLVSDVVGQLTTGFTEARSRLEHQWSRGEEVSTEDLRVALTRYRDFFERLLAV